MARDAFDAKVAGTANLQELVGDEPDFVAFTSALATVLGGLGQADYCGANAFLDAFALSRSAAPGPRWPGWTGRTRPPAPEAEPASRGTQRVWSRASSRAR